MSMLRIVYQKKMHNEKNPIGFATLAAEREH